MNLLDDFLSNAMACTESVNEEYFRTLLSVLLGREIKTIKIKYQKPIFGALPNQRGIRLDVEIEELDDNEELVTVYDLEPHLQNDLHFAKHSRYYQSKIDSERLKSGEKNFGKLPELFIITITNFDIFGDDRMVYSFQMTCKENSDIPYNDDVYHIYFNTSGSKCDSVSIRNMLKYLQETRRKNAVDTATQKVDALVSQVKNLDGIRGNFMTWGDVIDREVNEARAEAKAEELLSLLCKKLRRGISDTAVLAEHLEEPIESVEALLKQLEPYAPGYDLPEGFKLVL